MPQGFDPPPLVNNYLVCQADTWERTPSCPPSGNLSRERTPSKYSYFGDRSQPITHVRPSRLRFVMLLGFKGAERLLRQNINRDRRVRLDDITMVISVNDRS